MELEPDVHAWKMSVEEQEFFNSFGKFLRKVLDSDSTRRITAWRLIDYLVTDVLCLSEILSDPIGTPYETDIELASLGSQFLGRLSELKMSKEQTADAFLQILQRILTHTDAEME